MDRVFIFGTETREEAEAKQSHTPGHYRKFNGACSCGLCTMRDYTKQKRLKRAERMDRKMDDEV